MYGIAWKNRMEMGRGGACVPAHVALQGRIRRSIPRAQYVYFWYGNAAVRTFGRAHRHRPYGFVWADYAWTVDVVGQIMRGWLVSFEQIARGWLVAFGQIAYGRLALFLHYSARMPLRILFFYAFYFCSVYFFNG